MLGSPFRAELFTVPLEYEETPLRDRKSVLPDLRDSQDTKKFIQHVIALANSARLFGKPAYLLYGITDEEQPEIVGIGSSLEQYGAVDDSRIWENVRHRFGEIIERYIIPPLPNWDLKHGEHEGKHLAYLVIHPVSPPEPFRVSRDLSKQLRAFLRAEQSWIRFGESKREVEFRQISPAGNRYCYSYAQVPYILPKKWHAYFKGVLADPAIIHAQQINAYQELRSEDGRFLWDVVKGYLDSDRESFLIIMGVAGCGKSVFLRRLAAHWANAGCVATEGQIAREEFTTPPDWIPLYFPLRGERFQDANQFIVELLNRLNELARLWSERPSTPEQLLEQENLRWLICLDGLDEIWSFEGQERFLEVLLVFKRHYPKVKTILATRPDISIPDGLGRVEVLSLLTDEQILAYIANYVDVSGSEWSKEPRRFQEAQTLLQSNPELWELCGIPLYLEAALQELANSYEPPLEEVTLSSQTETELEETLVMSQERDNKFVFTVINANELILTSPIEEVETRPFQRRLAGFRRVFGRETVTQAAERNDSATLSQGPGGAEPEVIEARFPEQEEGPISLGRLLDNIYRALWKRERGRRPSLFISADRWWEATGKLAIHMDGHCTSIRYDAAKEVIDSDQALHWVLSQGILRCRPSCAWLKFTTGLTKEYFAAAFLLPFVEEKAFREARSYVVRCTPEFQERVHELLRQITYDELESLFLGGDQ